MAIKSVFCTYKIRAKHFIAFSKKSKRSISLYEFLKKSGIVFLEGSYALILKQRMGRR